VAASKSARRSIDAPQRGHRLFPLSSPRICVPTGPSESCAYVGASKPWEYGEPSPSCISSETAGASALARTTFATPTTAEAGLVRNLLSRTLRAPQWAQRVYVLNADGAVRSYSGDCSQACSAGGVKQCIQSRPLVQLVFPKFEWHMSFRRERGERPYNTARRKRWISK
jgi:hypothetical protein